MSPVIIRNAIIIPIRVIFICIKPCRLPYPRYQNPIYGIFPIITPSSPHSHCTTAPLHHHCHQLHSPKNKKSRHAVEDIIHALSLIGGCPVSASVFRSKTAWHPPPKTPDSQCYNVGWIINSQRTLQDLYIFYTIQGEILMNFPSRFRSSFRAFFLNKLFFELCLL